MREDGNWRDGGVHLAEYGLNNLAPGITGIILAGGESRRFGSDKASALFAGRPMLQWVLDAVAAVATEILVSTAVGQSLPGVTTNVPIRVLVDPVAAQGPLVGMAAAFAEASNEACIVVSCDTPLVEPELLRALVERLEERDAVIPEVAGKRQPLIAAYRRTACAAVFRECLEAKVFSVNRAIERLETVVVVGEDELRERAPELSSFVGVNSRAELARAEALVKLRRTNSESR